MYLPLGCLLGMMAHRRNWRSFTMLLLAIAGVSLTFETLQLLVPSRYPSIDDVIFNTAGGTLGVRVRLLAHGAPGALVARAARLSPRQPAAPPAAGLRADAALPRLAGPAPAGLWGMLRPRS